MSLLARAILAALAGFLLANPATAGITDRDMTCAQYLRAGSKAGTADWPPAVQARIRRFCAANPKMKAIDAEMTMTGD
jgi:hypothetical protein